ncbi:MAG: helix-turn-helix domain-containing protein [Acutalibacteraceae bacterium]
MTGARICDLTLEYVGNFVGVAKSTVRKWENGDIENISALRLQKLANVLGTTVDYLMDGVTSNLTYKNVEPMPDSRLCRSSVKSLAASRFLRSRISRATRSLIGAFTLILLFAA